LGFEGGGSSPPEKPGLVLLPAMRGYRGYPTPGRDSRNQGRRQEPACPSCQVAIPWQQPCASASWSTA
jgi:hypothetical protein